MKDGKAGLLFELRNVDDLREKINPSQKDPDKIILMGKTARAFVRKELNAEKHYQRLMEIYRIVIA